MTFSDALTVLALLNAMLGETILVLPVLAIKAGYISIIIITVYLGTLSGYCTYLLAMHLGKSESIPDAILEHFNGKRRYQLIYSVVICVSFALANNSFYQLTTKQIQGFSGPSPWVGILLSVGLFIETLIMRKYKISDKLLSLGFVSTICYLVFLIWAQVTAPSGPNKMNSFEAEFIDLAVVMLAAFSVQNIVDRILTKNVEPQRYPKIMVIMSALAILAYSFIAFGSFALINRMPRVEDPQIIEQYFPYGNWQVSFIQVVYFVHLVSVIPEYAIALKCRFFKFFGIEEGPSIQLYEVLFFLAVFGIELAIYLLKIRFVAILEFNGAIIGYLIVLVFPIALHVKCVYFSDHDEETGELLFEVEEENGEMVRRDGRCRCNFPYRNSLTKKIELAYLITGLMVGAFVMYYTLYTLFAKPQQNEEM